MRDILERPYAEKYTGNDNYNRPWSRYIHELVALGEDELVEKTAEAIYWSAWAANNRQADFHTHLDICCDEMRFRGVWDVLYQRAFDMAKENAGLT